MAEAWETEEGFDAVPPHWGGVVFDAEVALVPDALPDELAGPRRNAGDPILRNALEHAFDLVEQGATPAEARARTVELFARQPEALRHLDRATTERLAEARAVAGDPALSFDYIQEVVDADTSRIRHLAAGGGFDAAARTAHGLADQLEFHATDRSWEREPTDRGIEL